jgi:hypothetical protein
MKAIKIHPDRVCKVCCNNFAIYLKKTHNKLALSVFVRLFQVQHTLLAAFTDTVILRLIVPYHNGLLV